MELRTLDSITQTYFLGIDQASFDSCINSIEEAGKRMEREMKGEVGGWNLFSWLGRHAICAIRPVRVISGLDSFTLDFDGMPGMIDVAEILAYGFEDLEQAEESDDCLVRRFDQLESSFDDPGILFITFVRLNWQILENQEAWKALTKETNRPTKTQILCGFCDALKRGTRSKTARSKIDSKTKFLVSGGFGDADLILMGNTNNRRSLDTILYLVTQIGLDSLSAALFGDDAAKAVPSIPVVADSITELAIPLSLYSEVISAARSKFNRGKTSFGDMPESIRRKIDRHLEGKIRGEIGLHRGLCSLGNLHNEIQRIAGDGWIECAVLGGEDIVVQPRDDLNLSDLLWLLAKLDVRLAEDGTFPRKMSFRLSYSDLVADRHHRDGTNRADWLEFEGDPKVPDWINTTSTPPPPEDVNTVVDFLKQMRASGQREDLRIVERMIERAATLRKHPELGAATKVIATAVFDRVAMKIRRLNDVCELRGSKLRELEKLESAEPKSEECEFLKSQIIECEKDEVLMREHLIDAGMHFDRSIAHQVRGVVPLLLHPAVHARGQDHIGSEVLLSRGLAAGPRCVVRRIIRALEENFEELKDRKFYQLVLAELEDISEPIIYASHDSDFLIFSFLGMIRVPRWVLWYPTSASFVMHEVGHGIAQASNIDYLAKAAVRILSSPSAGKRFKGLCLGKFVKDASPRLELNSRSLANRWRTNLNELAAEVVGRLFSHAQSDSKKYLFDYLDHLDVIASRKQPEARMNLLLRQLSVYVAVEQISLVQSGDLCDLWASAPRKTRARWKLLSSDFIKYLNEWAEQAESCNRPGDYKLTIRNEVLQFVHRFGGPDFSKPEFAEAIDWGQFFAVMVTIPFRPSIPDISLLRGQIVWQSVLRASAGVTNNDEKQIDEFAKQISKGIVPREVTEFPERLPRAVYWCFRESSILPKIPLRARLALIMYLRDLTS